MDGLAETVLDTVSRYGMIETGDLVLAAVSGGPDSICMLDLLVGLRERLDIELRVVHVDHVTRDGESAADARFVETVASRYGLECETIRADVAGQRRNGESFEDAARRVRYAAFEDAVRRSGAGTVATAHTADDQAETVLMRIVRGTGPRGMTGIPPVSVRAGFRVVRPLIDVWRNDIETYLRDRSLDVRRDITNETECCLRNKIRLRLIPTLEKEFNPAVKTALVRMANLSREEQSFLESIAREMAEPVADVRDERRVTVRRPEFRRLPKPVARRGIMGWAEHAVGRPWRGTAESVDAICDLLMSDTTTGQTCFVDGLSVRLEYDCGIIESAMYIEQPDKLEPVGVDVPGRVEIPWTGRAITVRYR
ncbi:MAG: tRNA lysidine(34) synthetase TilS, partial [Candidatus Hydrogenedentes bacterium]|nr:tRNA lysidine(34) synthetase TilS [Candidatus Hydrogenedentota bacterium]